MKQWTEKPLNNKRTNSQKLKTYSAPPPPTVGNKVCDIEEHHRAITNRENTVSHHRLIVCQWLLSDMQHYPYMYKVCAGRSIRGRHPREITQHRSKNPLYNEKIYKYEYEPPESKDKKHMRKELHDTKNRKTPVRWKLQKGKNVWVCLAFYEVAQGGQRGGDTHPPPPATHRSQVPNERGNTQ